MENYIIVTDCTADLPQEVIQKYDIKVIPMEVTMENKTFTHYADFREMSMKEFYERLRAGELASTSQINPAAYQAFFTPFLEAGKDILYICFSSGLSSTFQSCSIAVNELINKYPNQKIKYVDSLAASGGEGLTTYYACKNRENGMSIEDNYVYLETNKLHIAHWFTVDDLNHLKRGGRVSAATALVGSALSIKPILHVDNDGHLINVSKAHGRRKSLNALIDKLKTTGINTSDQSVFLTHGDAYEDALYVKETLEKEHLVKEVIISEIGPVIGTHSGPGTIAFFFYADFR